MKIGTNGLAKEEGFIGKYRDPDLFKVKTGGRVGLVVRALAFHQCGPGSISAPGVICGLSLLVLYSSMRGFPPGTCLLYTSDAADE